jgi:Uma2 family endonuclease
MSPAPSRKHQQILVNLLLPIGNYLNGKSCFVYCAPFDVRLTRQKNAEEVTTIVQPDLCVIRDASKLDEQGCNGAPELIIEILSPGNTHKEMKDKFDLYQEAGVEEYWIVHPQDNNVLIYELNEEGKFIGKQPLTEDDILTSNLLTDLTINLKNIFAEK